MSKIEIQKGEDWVEVAVDGTNVHRGHDLPLFAVEELLRKLGHAVSHRTVEFCSGCSLPFEPGTLKVVGFDKACPTCLPKWNE